MSHRVPDRSTETAAERSPAGATVETGPAGPRGGISIQLNGAPREIPVECSVARLLELTGLGRATRVAVAVNRDVVPRSQHATRCLAAGDRVEILEAVGGG